MEHCSCFQPNDIPENPRISPDNSPTETTATLSALTTKNLYQLLNSPWLVSSQEPADGGKPFHTDCLVAPLPADIHPVGQSGTLCNDTLGWFELYNNLITYFSMCLFILFCVCIMFVSATDTKYASYHS
jgi:hypothetical protein